MDILIMPIFLLSQEVAETLLYTSLGEQGFACEEYKYHENITCDPRCAFYTPQGGVQMNILISPMLMEARNCNEDGGCGSDSCAKYIYCGIETCGSQCNHFDCEFVCHENS